MESELRRTLQRTMDLHLLFRQNVQNSPGSKGYLVECGECARAWHIPSRGSMCRLTAGSLTWTRRAFYTLMRCAVLLGGHARCWKCCLRMSVHPCAKKEFMWPESLSVSAKRTGLKVYTVQSALNNFQGWDKNIFMIPKLFLNPMFKFKS